MEVSGAQSDWKLCIAIEERDPKEDWRDFEREFRELSEQVQTRFRNDRWYHGIEYQIPFRLLGKLGASARLEQAERDYDKVMYRRVRLAEED